MTSQFNVGDIVKLTNRGAATGTLSLYDTRMVRWVSDDGKSIGVRTSIHGAEDVQMVRLPSGCFQLVRRGKPPAQPFEVGDIIRCHTGRYADVRHGEDAEVEEMTIGTMGEWLVKVHGNGKKYYARNFHKAPKELQPVKQETETMFVAMRLVDNSMQETVRAIDSTEDVLMKAMADKEQLRRWVADRVATTGEAWALLYTAQICRPQARVEWTNAS